MSAITLHLGRRFESAELHLHLSAACSCTGKCHAGAVSTSCPLCAVNMTG